MIDFNSRHNQFFIDFQIFNKIAKSKIYKSVMKTIHAKNITKTIKISKKIKLIT